MVLNTGDTAWVLISAALVLLMTPGLAFFYSGMVSSRNVMNTMNMSFVCLGIVPLTWAILGFSLAFSTGNGFIGGFEWAGLPGLNDTLNNTIPQYAFILFQMMFAVITPALISGSVVGRMKFKAFMFFVIIWSLIIYAPIAHWVWGPGGWIASLGAIDFAGGTVVHINAGFAALAAALVLGPRLAMEKMPHETPHNVPFVILGASLLWFGWYGFNAGSALGANQLAATAFMTTTLATAAAILTWSTISWLRGVYSTGIGKATAAIIGLVAITPATGYVTPIGAMIIGAITSTVCYFCLHYRDKLLKRIDDTLDVFICHGVGGVTGSILTGIFATTTMNSAGANGLLYGNPGQLWKQIVAVAATAAMSFFGTAIILFVLKMLLDIRPTKESEAMGIDVAEHGEVAYSDRINRM